MSYLNRIISTFDLNSLIKKTSIHKDINEPPHITTLAGLNFLNALFHALITESHLTPREGGLSGSGTAYHSLTSYFFLNAYIKPRYTPLSFSATTQTCSFLPISISYAGYLLYILQPLLCS